MLSFQQPHPDDPPDHMATQAEADREWVQNVAHDRADQAWLLSDRDVWYPNPAYRGPRVPHPESLEAEFGEGYGYADTLAPEEQHARDAAGCDDVPF